MVSVLNTVDTAHEDMIHDAQMDYYGTHLATCSSDRTVKIFEVKNNTQRLLSTLQGHEGPVWQIAWAHPMYGNILASCSYDRKVIVWYEQSGQWSKMYEYSEHDSSVNSVCWAPYELGLVLACGSSDGAVSILTCKDGNWETRKISNAHSVGCNAVSWAPAVVPGSLVEPPSNSHKSKRVKKLVTGGCDNLVKIWCEKDGEDWEEEVKLEGHDNWVRDVAWAPSIGLPKSKIASCCQEGQVIIWTNEGNSTKWASKLLNKFDDVVWHVSWSLTGDILAVSGGDNKVTLWKEGLDGQWDCISDVSKTQNGQSNID